MASLRYRPLAGNWPKPEPLKPKDTAATKRMAKTTTCGECGAPLSRYNPTTTCWHHDYQVIEI